MAAANQYCAVASALTGITALILLTAPGLFAGDFHSEPEDISAPPGAEWAHLTPEEVAAASAAANPVTRGPPAVRESYVPLLARLRRRRGGLHPLGSQAPVRSAAFAGKITRLTPHLRSPIDVWKQRFLPFPAASEATATLAPLWMATPPPEQVFPHPAAPSGSDPLPVVVSMSASGWSWNQVLSTLRPLGSPVADSEQAVSWRLQAKREVGGSRSATMFFAAAAILGLAVQAYRLVELAACRSKEDALRKVGAEQATGSVSKSPLVLLQEKLLFSLKVK